MKLWLLKPADGELWKPWYDKVFGHVVRAEDERAARALAADECGAEGGDAWLNEGFSECIELTADGARGVILTDLRSA